MYHNLPAEMQALRQWVVWDWVQKEDGKWTKEPRQMNGYRASVMNPDHWGTFADAVAMSAGRGGIGFVLSPNDPFSIIDLDDKPDNPASDADKEGFRAILQAVPSYTEISPSGYGLHIVVKGKIPEGMRYGHVEIYSSGRYMACTGNHIPGYPQDIRDAQGFLTRAYVARQMEISASESDGEEILSDAEVVELASNASDGAKYDQLCGPNWDQMGYPSGSEAEFALLSMLCFWTKNNAQVYRLFRMTTLGKRQQSYDGRVKKAIARIRGKQAQTIDFSQFKSNLDNSGVGVVGSVGSAVGGNGAVGNGTAVWTDDGVVEISGMNVDRTTGEIRSRTTDHAPAVEYVPPVPEVKPWSEADKRRGETDIPIVRMRGKKGLELSFPPGLVGEIAAYVLRSSVHPVPEIALTAALAFMAGVCGRSYNYSQTGLNLYLIMVGRTGVGKGEINKATSKLFKAIRPKVPSIDGFRGPATIASGPGLRRALEQSPCFVSMLGEIGETLQAITSPRRNAAEAMYHKALLDIFSLSGHGDVLGGTSYSQVEKNSVPIESPAFSFVGEATTTLYEHLNEDMIATGLLPRMLFVETDAERTKLNNQGMTLEIPDSLLQKLVDLSSQVLTAQHNRTVVTVKCSPEAFAMDDAFEDSIIAKTNADGHNNVTDHLWNRVHLNARKVAALLAVGSNMYAPVIEKEHMAWAIAFVQNSCEHLLAKFSSGDIGVGDTAQAKKLEKCIRDYMKKDPASLAKRHKSMPKMQEMGIVPYSYLQQQLGNVMPFRDARNGSAKALHDTIDVLVKAGRLSKIIPVNSGYSGEAYKINY